MTIEDVSKTIKKEMPMRHISIMLDTERLHFYFEDDMLFLPRTVRNIVKRKHETSFVHMEGLTTAMRIALHQMLNCQLRGPIKKLYLESRALELVAYQLEQVMVSNPFATNKLSINPNERKRTDFARELLLDDLENPPGLEELARSVGMSHPKLNRCFRQVYGMTVFQYLRSERLSRAREMIEHQGLTVTETAFSVGYDSLSHFAKAYKKHFGISPGAHFRTV